MSLDILLPLEDEHIILTSEQQVKILERLEQESEYPPTIKELIILAFGREYDARSKFGVAVRKFMTEKQLKFRNTKDIIASKKIELDEEQRNFVTKNMVSMKPLEMARILFQDNKITNLSAETRAIYSYIKELPTGVQNAGVKLEDMAVEDYVPPKTQDQAIVRINRYANTDMDRNGLNEKQKRDIKNLINYLHTIRFLSQINTYSKSSERTIFEAEFIRCTYNKSLTQEEVSQYIMYCTEVIIAQQINKRVQDLEEEQDRQIQENNGRPNMALVEQISALRGEFNQCINRQKNSLKSLQGERKERLKLDSENKGNISDLIVYALSEEKRQHLLNIAAERRIKIKDEIERIKNMDEIKAEIFGITEQEILD